MSLSCRICGSTVEVDGAMMCKEHRGMRGGLIPLPPTRADFAALSNRVSVLESALAAETQRRERAEEALEESAMQTHGIGLPKKYMEYMNKYGLTGGNAEGE